MSFRPPGEFRILIKMVPSRVASVAAGRVSTAKSFPKIVKPPQKMVAPERKANAPSRVVRSASRR